MTEWNADENPYEVLGLNVESSKEEQKKRYRKLVLEKHPDKQPDNKKAAEEFIKIQRAYEIINDDKAREAWAALQRARSARETKHAWQSEKRRKMAQDLEKREAAYEAERSKEKMARDKLQAELARLKREMAEREEQRQARILQDRIASNFAASQAGSQSAQMGAQLQRTVKASWDLDLGDYTAEELRAQFSQHGPVEEVIPRQAKKKSKGSALIIMMESQGALKAVNNMNGNLTNPILAVPVAKATSHSNREERPTEYASTSGTMEPQGKGFSSNYTPSFPSKSSLPSRPLFAAVHFPSNAAPSNAGASSILHSSFEEGIFAKMRRKAEEDRLAASKASTSAEGSQ